MAQDRSHLPLYYAHLTVNAILSYAAGLSLAGYGWFVFYLGNHFIGETAPDTTGGVIGHLWSLAVEEQFYLFWPFIVFFSRRMWPFALAAVIAAPVFREAVLTVTGNPYLAIVTLPSCMDMLAAGALVALRRSRGWRESWP